MNNDWTIDTVILYKYAEFDAYALEFIQRILRCQNFVVMDHEGNIDSQYRKCFLGIGPQARHALNLWYTKIRKRFFSCSLMNDCKQRLAELNFHNDDLPFVAVCLKSLNKKLVSTDSGYTGEIKHYLGEI